VAIGTPVVKTESFSDSNATSYNTASVTCTANKLYLLIVGSGDTAGATTVPTATGGGQTWTLVLSNQQGTGNQRLTILRALSAAPGAGAVINIAFAGVTHESCSWKVVEIDGVLTTGTNGADAISESAQIDDSGATNQVSLASVASGNATVGALVGNSSSVVFSADTGFTAIGAQIDTASPVVNLYAVYSLTGTNPISINSGGTPITALIGLELAKAPVAHALAGVHNGVSTTTGTIIVALRMAGVSAGVSTTTGSLVLAASLTGLSAGVSTTTGTLRLAMPLAGTTTGASTVVGDLSVEEGVTDPELEGVIAGVSTVTGALDVAHTLEGSTAGVSTVAGALDVPRLLEGIAAGVSTVSGDLNITIPLAGVTGMVVRVYGDLTNTERVWLFTPPTEFSGTPISNDPTDRPLNQSMGEWLVARRLFSFYNRREVGLSVLKLDGEYVVMDMPSQDEQAMATEVYLGGHEYPVSEEVAAALMAAGFTVI
jgi:hypothetical protein